MKINRVHFYYIIGILGFLLIISLSVNWSSVPRLPEILSFALGFASFVLAMVAISQSLNSSQGIAKGIEEISFASKSVSDATVQLQDAANSIAASAASFPHEKIDQVARNVTAMMDSINDNANTETQKNADLNTDEEIDPFENITIGGLLSYYIVLSAAGSKKKFLCTSILSNKALGSYCDGFIASIRSSQLAGIDISDGDFIVVRAPKSTNKKQILSNIKSLDDKDVLSYMLESVGEVDAYFSKTPRRRSSKGAN
ncbi:MAG: hypothetical protein KF842_01620 [Caulobacter sp.]|nr:hypothetical protein [Caulobacter sp.]